MNKINIPKTDLHASTLALGTDYFGSTVSREVSMELMDHYLEAGGNVIDTAESYACWLPGGEHQSEKVIGEWLRERGTRDQIVLSTKGAHPKRESMDVPRLSKAEIQADLDSSLRRLGVEQIDLYWLHRDSPGYPVEEILESLEAFRQAGKIKHAGFSNWTQSRAEEARLAAERLGMQGFVASQNMWSLAKPDVSQADSTWTFIDESFVRWHIAHGLSAFAYLAQANGYFRRLEQNTLDKVPADARVRILFDHQENRDRFQRIRRLQQEYRFSVGQIVIGYLISQPLPVFALVGPKTLTDLKDCIACADTKLSKEDTTISNMEKWKGLEPRRRRTTPLRTPQADWLPPRDRAARQDRLRKPPARLRRRSFERPCHTDGIARGADPGIDEHRIGTRFNGSAA